MKSGMSLQELAAELERRRSAKADYIAPAARLAMVAERDGGAPAVALDVSGVGAFPLTNNAHAQVGGYVGIPKPYYDRMLVEAPELLAVNVNRWLGDHASEGRMVRTLDGSVRALLSDRYRALENEDLAEAVLPVLMERGAVVWSANITETRFYLKAVDEKIVRDIPKGHAIGDGTHAFFDTVSPAVSISNSEVGAGSLAICTSIFTKACTNLAVFERSVRKYHVGGRADTSEDAYRLLTDETRRQLDRAFWLQCRDVTQGALAEAEFDRIAEKLRAAAGDEIKVEVPEVVRRVSKAFSLSSAEADSILTRLAGGGDLSRYGLHAAVTRTAEDVEDYGRASELEVLGGKLIELPKAAWRELAVAA